MAKDDGDDSDVSAITISDDDAPHTAAALRKASAPAARGGAGGSATGSKPAKPSGKSKRRGQVAFQLPSKASADEPDAEEWDGDADGYPDDDQQDGDPDGPVEDETKPLGWSYFRKRDASEGPAVWEEVDVAELEFVAENLVRSTTTRASQADEVIQQIFQSNPVAEDALVSDPLGRGYIDPLTLTLGKKSKLARAVLPAGSEKGLKATMRSFRTARLGPRQQGRTDGAEGAAGGSNAESGASGLDEETRKVLPNQEGFDPEAYLATFHADSSMSQLQKGLRVLSRELSERTGQLKLLIRNNFDRFINCKDAIDDIHAKLRKMLVRGGGGGGGGGRGGSAAEVPSQQQQQQGVGTERIIRSLEQLDAQARRTFGPILERAAKADRIRAVSSLLQRFDHLFAAPQRILELASRGELEQVIREYKRANMLIRPTATTARVWVSLYAEIEKRVTEVYLAVKQLVSEPPPEGRTSVPDDAGSASALGGGEAWRGYGGGGGEQAGQNRLSQLPDYLLFLALIRQERLPAARDEDPMRLYVSRLEAHVVARIQDLDKLHTEQLGQLVTAWMKATAGPGAGGGLSTAGPPSAGALGALPPSGVAALRASLALVAPRDNPGRDGRGADPPGGGDRATDGPRAERGQQGGGNEAEESDVSAVDEDVDDADEEAEAAEAAFLLWQGNAASLPFAGTATLPQHIRRELTRLVQDPGGLAGFPGALGLTGAPAPASVPRPYGDGGAAAEPLPASAHAPEPVLTATQRQWVYYVCSVSMLLLWSLPGLWATCNSTKFGSNADLDEQAKESLERGPSLARRLVESLCSKYAARLRRAVQSLARAGPMQPGLPLVIKDACHLWASLRRVGVGTRALSPLRAGVMAALGAHAGVLEDHMATLPQNLFGADDFRLDVMAADHQPVTALPRRLEEEVGVALLHYQWPLHAVVDAAGGVEQIPPDSGWRPMQGSVFACFALLSEALAEYARSLHAGRGGSEEDNGSSRESSRSKLPTSSAAENGPTASAAGSRGAVLPGGGAAVSSKSLGGDSLSASADALESGSMTKSDSVGGSGSDDVRMLLVISNSAMIRTRVMPRVVERYRKLLAPTSEASASCQRRLRDLTAAMRRSNEALGSSYLARKEAAVQAAVRRYIAAETAPLLAPAGDGAAAASALPATGKRSAASATAAAASRLLPGPSGPSDGCSAILQLLVAVHNEALTYSPSNLGSFMEALAEHLVDQLVRAYHGLVTPAPAGGGKGPAPGGAQAAQGVTVEQLVQLWADLAFLSAALRQLLVGSLAADLEDAKVLLAGAIASRQRSRRYRPASAPAAAVAGQDDGEAASAALQELLGPDVELWLRRHALNLRCFAAAGEASAATLAAAPQGAASSAAAVPSTAGGGGSTSGSSGNGRSTARGGASAAAGEGASRQTSDSSAPAQSRGWRESLRSAAPMAVGAAEGHSGRRRQG